MIEKWTVTRDVIEGTERAFRIGAHEVFAMWTAALKESGAECRIRRCVVPRQKPGFSPLGGAYVHIEGRELSRIQFENYDRGERSVIQLHTHPGADVTMSELDRKWEVVCHVGALSIIVPSYCKYGLLGFPGASVYERDERDWRRWDAREIGRRLIIT
jgi:proteasome lid subunit RPN8/RPN11